MSTCDRIRIDPVDEIQDPVVRFRLHYEGPLLASSGEPQNGQADRRKGHKDDIRRVLHGQLKHYWDSHAWLTDAPMPWSMFDMAKRHDAENAARERTPLAEGLGQVHEVCGVRFVPLVCKQFTVLCGIKLLLLRRDKPGGIISARDLDNRLKTIFDALRMPHSEAEFAPALAANPTYVLLQDDDLISSVSIETDDLLDPPDAAGKDDSYVRLLIEVDIRPYFMGAFAQMFASH